MQIISPTHSIQNGVGRIYSTPQFVKVSGQWRRIADVLTVRADATLPGFRIDHAGSSITLRIVSSQADTFKASASNYKTSWDHFEVSVNDLVPDELVWKVETTGKVSKVADYWKFDELKGCAVGLDVSDWKELFQEKISIIGNTITMDMRTLKEKMNTVIVLDPATIIDLGLAWSFQRATNDSWAAARASNTGGGAPIGGTTLLHAMSRFLDITYSIRRGYMQFDTSDIGAFFRAFLFVTQAGAPTLTQSHISRLFFASAVNDLAIYGDIQTAYTDRPIGFLKEKTFRFLSVDITRELEASTTFNLAFSHRYDVLNLGPAPTEIDMLLMTTETPNAPYIEYTNTKPRMQRVALGTRDWLTGVT